MALIPPFYQIAPHVSFLLAFCCCSRMSSWKRSGLFRERTCRAGVHADECVAPLGLSRFPRRVRDEQGGEQHVTFCSSHSRSVPPAPPRGEPTGGGGVRDTEEQDGDAEEQDGDPLQEFFSGPRDAENVAALEEEATAEVGMHDRVCSV
mmetsp:Transcript_66955/g.108569  ORF Transcript_66955/g.108569 Transcript_66955/m.108569 type:complete len:149 (+) Transcript_66955:428-874(+)